MKLVKFASAATFCALVAAMSGSANAAPTTSFDDGFTMSGDDSLLSAGPVNHGGAALFGQAPGVSTPVPQPALIPPAELDTSYAAGHGTGKAADADLPEPPAVALLLAGLALLGLTAHRAGARR